MMIKGLIVSLSLLAATNTFAHRHATQRVSEFSNGQVNVWQTTIAPGAGHGLTLHHHQYDRVVVAFNDGLLKIKNDKNQVHYLKLKKDKAYYLAKDTPNELHSDENISHHPIKVLVIELLSSH